MKVHSGPPRKLNRAHLDARIRRARLEHLATTEGDTPVHHTKKNRHAMNWRVSRCSSTEVVAIEPNREYETPFEGDTAFWDAVEFAAAELRNGGDR